MNLVPAPHAGGPLVAGLVLAAGGGLRMGRPKALLASDGVGWTARAVATLSAAGCGPVVVTIGAEAEAARACVPPAASAVVVEGWRRGVGESLREGLGALARLAPGARAVVVTLVDLPGLRTEAVDRVLGADEAANLPAALRQARYDGRPGHPVLIGREHWGPLGAELAGDVGARDYLRAHHAVAVDCTDLGGGDDVDVPR